MISELGTSVIVLPLIAIRELVLYQTFRPTIIHRMQRAGTVEMLVIASYQSLVYSSVEYRKVRVVKLSQQNLVKTVVIEDRAVNYIDSTVGKLLSSFVEHLEVQECPVVFWNWQLPVQHCRLSVRCQVVRATLHDWRLAGRDYQPVDIG